MTAPEKNGAGGAGAPAVTDERAEAYFARRLWSDAWRAAGGADRRKALERATDLFEKISRGEITPESYAENGQLDEDTRPANAPVFAPAHPERLLD